METRDQIVDPALEPTPPGESTGGPLGDGAGWGAVVGAALGLLTVVAFVGPLAIGQEYSLALDELPGLLVILAFAGFVGACYGAVTGFVAGFGAILVPTPGTTRRLAVSGLALTIVGTTVAAFSVAWGTLALAPESLVVLLLVVGLASWLVAPRLRADQKVSAPRP